MITQQDSVGYRLAKTAASIYKTSGEKLAADFLIHNLNRYGFKHWEQIAIASTYKFLIRNNEVQS